MSRYRILLVLVAVLLGLSMMVAGTAFVQLVVHGVSARDEPTAMESWAARMARKLATPSKVRTLKNPVPADEASLADARAHFADHCASCHGNDGRGRTAMGQNLYPKAPDMTSSRTQQLTDGELFTIITNGIRLTGMPAWGAGSEEDNRSTWRLVHFIRSLPSLTAAQVEEMKGMNPKSRAQFEQEERERRWLEGADTPDSAPDHSTH